VATFILIASLVRDASPFMKNFFVAVFIEKVSSKFLTRNVG